MTPRTIEEEMLRAGEARQVFDSEIFQEACKRIEEGLAAQRREVPMRDIDMHTRLILTEQLWEGLKGYLKQTVETGRFAEFELKRQMKLREQMAEMARLWR